MTSSANIDRFFRQLKTAMRGEHLPSLARRAGCAVQTLYNWQSDKVECPHLRTACGVANALGLQVTLLRANR